MGMWGSTFALPPLPFAPPAFLNLLCPIKHDRTTGLAPFTLPPCRLHLRPPTSTLPSPFLASQYDEVVLDALENKVTAKAQLKGHLDIYRYCDNVRRGGRAYGCRCLRP